MICLRNLLFCTNCGSLTYLFFHWRFISSYFKDNIFKVGGGGKVALITFTQNSSVRHPYFPKVFILKYHSLTTLSHIVYYQLLYINFPNVYHRVITTKHPQVTPSQLALNNYRRKFRIYIPHLYISFLNHSPWVSPTIPPLYSPYRIPLYFPVFPTSLSTFSYKIWLNLAHKRPW